MLYTRVDTTFLALVDGEEFAVLNLTRGEVAPVGTRVFESVGAIDLGDGESVLNALMTVYEAHRDWIDAFRAARRALETAGFKVHLGKAVGRVPGRGRVTVYFQWPEGAVIRTKREEVFVRAGREPRPFLEEVLAKLAALGARVSPSLAGVEPLRFQRVELRPVAGRVVDASGRPVAGYFLPNGSIRSLVSSRIVNVDPAAAEEAVERLVELLNRGFSVDTALEKVAGEYSAGARWKQRAEEAEPA